MAGRPRQIKDGDIIESIAQNPDPAVTAGEIAARLDKSNRAILNRLEDLEEDGVVGSKKAGARAKVWWLASQVSDAAARPSGVSQ